jgi:hypothetical protein
MMVFVIIANIIVILICLAIALWVLRMDSYGEVGWLVTACMIATAAMPFLQLIGVI